MEYHAHIYWRNASERARAIAFRDYLERQGCVMGRIWDTPIGPHTLPMYQAVYNSSNKDLVESYLKVNHDTISILLHESILDDLRDHTENVRWLGEELPLKLSIFNE